MDFQLTTEQHEYQNQLLTEPTNKYFYHQLLGKNLTPFQTKCTENKDRGFPFADEDPCIALRALVQ